MIVFASYHIKGGVGKTATAVNLAFLAARDGFRTLIWDLDPQGSATFYFRVKPKVKGGARGLVTGRRSLEEAVRGSDFKDLDLVPADFSYRKMDLFLDRKKKGLKALRETIAPLDGSYDVVVLDCPPGVSLASLAILYAAHVLVVPVIPTTLSIETLRRLRGFVRKKDALERLKVMPFFSMVDRRKSLHRDIIEQPPADAGPFLESRIPYASDVERMGIFRAPVGSFAPRSLSGDAYERLWNEIRGKVFPTDAGTAPAAEGEGGRDGR